MLVAGAVLEGDDAPLWARLRLALVHHLRLRIDGVAVEDGLGELDLLEAQIAHRGPQRGLAHGETHGHPEGEEAVHERLAEFGKPLVNSLFTLGVAVGLSVSETTLGTTVGNLGFEKVEFPKPVFHGDTIYAETEVVDKRESKSRPEWGIVTFEHRARNQHGDLVMKCRRAAMLRRKEA